MISAHDLSWWPWSESEEIPAEARTVSKAVFEHNETMREQRQSGRVGSLAEEDAQERVFLRELPDLKFYELDVVRSNRGEQMVVASINWHYYGMRREDGSFMPILNVRHPTEGWHTALDIKDASLVRRGNVWRWFTGRKNELQFQSVEEEADFYRGLGRCRSVPNREGVYSHSLEEAVAAVRRGEADCLAGGGGLFGSRGRVEVYKFEDEEPSRRIREKTLAGFAELATS